MTLKEKILQTFVVTIREINKHGGPEEFFKKYKVGGMYFGLLPDELDDGKPEMCTSLTRKRLAECRKASQIPLLVCADGVEIDGQEIKVLTSKSIGSSRNMQDAYNLGKIYGMQMNANDVDWLLGPIVDLYCDSSMPLFAMSDDPEVVAAANREIIRGVQDQGVCATAKHFPGLGTCNINMHFGHGKNVLPFDEWMETYGYIYKETFKEDVLSVMTTHTMLESYTKDYENGFAPIATYSTKLTTELLKDKLGFKGAVVTDALCMGGCSTGNVIDETVQAFKAGADLLLWPPVEAADKIEELILSGEIPMSRLDDALERINRMREFRNKALDSKSYDTPDKDVADELSREIIKNGICEYKNEIGLLPLDKNKIKKILLLDATENEMVHSTPLIKKALEEEGFVVDIRDGDICDMISQVCWQDDIEALQDRYDVVIFNMNMEYATSWKITYMLVWASQQFDKKKKIIVNYGAPFFAETYFPDDHTIIEVNDGFTYESVAHLVSDALLGRFKMTGKKVLTGKIKR